MQLGKTLTTLTRAVLLLTAIMINTTVSFAQVTQEWVARYIGTDNVSDNATSLTVDGSGNVYVTGGSGGINEDYATIKYDSSGVQMWVARYNGTGNRYDYASSIAVDDSGNVYVTGQSEGSGTSYDYATVKYNSSGVELWVARYNGPGNGNDPQSIAVDGLGNVYVTGWSLGSGTNWDYATIKYNSLGDTLWVQRYNGPGNGMDGGTSLAVDDSGNVYVTGDSNGSGTGLRDYATIKYNSAGVLQWVQRYNGPGNSTDVPSSIAVDGFGNVYVTGQSEGNGSSYDYATIKYNSLGDSLWIARYNGQGNGYDIANSLAVDDSGNVYLTGMSGGDFATIKYNSLGDTLWIATYNGPANNDDVASSLAVDNSGNVYVTGYTGGTGTSQDYATIKYNSSGDSVWVAIYNGPGNSYDYTRSIAVDGAGNVFVTGSSIENYEDYATIKYNSLGDSLWVARYNSYGQVNGSDYAYALAIDSSGNAYVTGTSDGDYATIKYNSLGDTLWVQRYNGPGNNDDEASSIVVDGLGNVYVTGESVGSGTSYDYATIKYNSSGVQQWVSRFNGPGNSDDMATSLAIDSSGNVYVTGYSTGSGTGYDYATIKYNSLGDTLWVQRYNSLGISYDRAHSLAVDDSGNVYVTGEISGNGTGQDYATIKYNSLGDTLWVSKYSGPGNYSDYATSLAIDDLGNVYVTGNSFVGMWMANGSIATLKYNSSGAQQWVQIYNGPGNAGDGARAVAVDDSGNVYVTGFSAANGSLDYATLKYNSSGVQQWVERYYGGGGSYGAFALALDGSGNVYVTGTSHGGLSNDDYATIKYNSLGDSLWVQRYNGPGNVGDGARAIAVDGSGNVYVTGFSAANGQLDYATIKYSQIMVGIPPISNEIPDAFLLVHNYPNPFSSSTVISFSLPQSQKVSLKIFDVNGRLVSSLADKNFEAGKNELLWNAGDVNAGIYFLRMETATHSENRKLIVTKE